MNAKRTTQQIGKDLRGRTIYNVSHVEKGPSFIALQRLWRHFERTRKHTTRPSDHPRKARTNSGK